MHKTVPMTVGRDTHNLRFGAIGAFLLQKELGLSIQEFGARVDNNTLGFMELHVLLYAELESARRADRVKPIPWTIDTVGDLIDAGCEGDLVEFWKTYSPAVIKAFQQSFHISLKQAAEIEARKQNAVVASAPTGDGDEANPTKAGESTGVTETPAIGTTA